MALPRAADWHPPTALVSHDAALYRRRQRPSPAHCARTDRLVCAGPVTLTAMYYTVATVATSATLVVREHNHLDQVCATAVMGCKHAVHG